MTSTRALAAVAVVCVLVSCATATAQVPPKPSDADTAAIKQLVADFYGSFSRHDAHATTMTFAPDADFTNMSGVYVKGHKDIEGRFTTLFGGRLKAATRTDTVKSIRFFTEGIALVDADTVITGTRENDGSEAPVRKGLMIVVVTKQNGRWLISNFHEAEFPPPRPAR